MKRFKLGLLILSLLMVFMVTGCDEEDNKTITPVTTENTIDVEAIKNELYEEVYNKFMSEVYETLSEDVLEAYEEEPISIDLLQAKIKTTVSKAQSANVLVTYVTTISGEEEGGTGSGVVFRKDTNPSGSNKKYTYYVLTNEHVVGEKPSDDTLSYYSWTIQYEDGTKIACKLIGSDESTDIGLLSFESDNTYSICEMGDSDTVSCGDFVLACGNPLGESLYNTVTLGICGGLERNLYEDSALNTRKEYIQHDAAINAGNSGGGLYNLDGKLIGINTAKYSSSEIEGLNFSIPVNVAKAVVSDILEYGYYRKNCTMGITTVDVGDNIRNGRVSYKTITDYYGMTKTYYVIVPSTISDGLIIAAVSENKSSYNILQEKDILVKVDNKTINSSSDLCDVLDEHLIGDTVEIQYYRMNKSGTWELKTASLTFIR